MSDLVPADQIEQIVGATRHPTGHIARADSDEQMVYILHSHRCKDSGRDLRECPFSLALDKGIDPDDWATAEDKPWRVAINRDGRLIPAAPGMRFSR